MESLLRPDGPEPERVYWVRRAVVLVALIMVVSLLLWLVGKAFGGRGDSQAAAPASTSAAASMAASSSSPTTPATPSSASPAVSAASTSPSEASSSASGSAPASSAHPTLVASSVSSVIDACSAQSMTLKVSSEPTVASGKSMTFTVTMTSKADCQLDTKLQAFELRIYSGNDPIWTTNHCATWQPDHSGLMRAGQDFEISIAWNGQRSGKNCELKNQKLGAGTYVATADMKGLRPAQRVFRLTA